MIREKNFPRLRGYFDTAVRFMKKPEYFFLTFASFFGILFVFLVPPMQAPDEQAHFFKAYQISNLQFQAEQQGVAGQIRYGAELPSSIHEAANAFMGNVSGNANNEFNKHLFFDYINQPLQPQKTHFIPNEGASIYSPTAYIPQAAGISIGKLFNASPLILIWLGRLANLAVWILLAFIAIKYLPFAKWGLTILALNPVILFLSASLSGDMIAIGLSFILFSQVASIRFLNNRISKGKIILLLIIAAALALTKPINLLLSLLLVLIPRQVFTTRLKYVLFIIGGIALTVAFALLWNIQARDIIQATGQIQRPGMGVNPAEQLSFVLDHPLSYVKTILYNYVFVEGAASGDAVLRSFFGAFGWLDTNLPLWTIGGYVACLTIAGMYQLGRGLVFTYRQKAFLLILFILAFVGNITAMYLNYTPVGSQIIEGVQGRYFLPISILLLGLFTARKKLLQITERNLSLLLFLMLIIILAQTTVEIYLRYYS